MKVLVVTSFNNGAVAPFVKEQVDALKCQGIECDFFFVEGKGWRGYLRNRSKLINSIKTTHPDIIHAHYGLCGLLANLQRNVPVVTTYHGSDINDSKALPFSKLSILLSSHNIFVSQSLYDKTDIGNKERSIIPCGINLSDFPIVGKHEAREKAKLSQSAKYILFAGAFDNAVKNPSLAKECIRQLPGATLIELKGYSREQVCWLLSAADALLMTSHNEGSPQVIKEALACGCPIVSVDVGDVKQMTAGVDGCRVVEADASKLARCISSIPSGQRTLGRQQITKLQLDNHDIAKRIITIYTHIVKPHQ